MRQTDEPVGHPILSGNNRNAFQIHENSSPFRVCHVVVGEREGQIPGQGGVGRDLGLKQRIQYAHNFLLSKVCRTTQIFPTAIGVRATNLNVDNLIYMSWCCLRLPLSNSQRRKEVWTWSMSQPNAVPALWPTEKEWFAACWVAPTYHWFLGYWNTYKFIFHEWTYMEPQRQAETGRAFKRTTNTSCDLVVFVEYEFARGESSQDLISTALHWLHARTW